MSEDKKYKPGIDGHSNWPRCSVCGKDLELIRPHTFDECCDEAYMESFDQEADEQAHGQNPF